MNERHRYRITVERLPPGEDAAPLRFEVSSHDEILGLVARVRQRVDFDADTAAAFTVGLRLLGETLIRHRDLPLFSDFGAHFGQFMRRLKSGTPGAEARPAD
jgi:hypothetical protein